jgi:hypothetical protein
LRAYCIIEPVIHLLLPLVLIVPFGVTVTQSPTAIRLSRRSVAPSIGNTIIWSLSFKSAKACPSTCRSPPKKLTSAEP